MTDLQGSVRDVVQGEVSGGTMTAAVVDHVIYTAFGAPDRRGRQPMPRFGFDGMRYDAATGFDLTATRPYDPQTGTWIQPDPIGFLGGQDNLSEFVGNDPTNFVDPSGLDPNGPSQPWWAVNRGDIPVDCCFCFQAAAAAACPLGVATAARAGDSTIRQLPSASIRPKALGSCNQDPSTHLVLPRWANRIPTKLSRA